MGWKTKLKMCIVYVGDQGGPPKEGSPSDATSSGEATGSIKESEVDQEPLTTEPPPLMPHTPSYYGYYYPGTYIY